MAKPMIATGWESYRKLLPANASPTQVAETRQAFYAGAAVLFEALLMTLEGGEEPTENDLKRMDAIALELREFGRSLDARYLQSSKQPRD